MGKTIPLKCNACSNVIGHVSEVNDTGERLEVLGTVEETKHKDDCPLLGLLAEGATLHHLSIGAYIGDKAVAANIFEGNKKEFVKEAALFKGTIPHPQTLIDERRNNGG